MSTFPNHFSLSFFNNISVHNEPDYFISSFSRPEPDVLEFEVKWAFRSTAVNKANGCDGIPAELFKTLKEDAVKVLHSICQHIWTKIHEKGTSFKIGCFFFVVQLPSDGPCDPMDCSTPGFPVPHHLPVCPSSCPLHW